MAASLTVVQHGRHLTKKKMFPVQYNVSGSKYLIPQKVLLLTFTIIFSVENVKLNLKKKKIKNSIRDARTPQPREISSTP